MCQSEQTNKGQQLSNHPKRAQSKIFETSLWAELHNIQLSLDVIVALLLRSLDPGSIERVALLLPLHPTLSNSTSSDLEHCIPNTHLF